MKNLIMLLIIVVSCLSCKSNTEPENKEQVYVVESIDNVLLKEWTEEMKNGTTDFPLEIEMKIENGKYSGTVKLFKLGALPIQNYDDNSGFKNSFYIDTNGKLPRQIQSIHFTKMEIKNNILTGIYVYSSPIIDVTPSNFIAKKQ